MKHVVIPHRGKSSVLRVEEAPDPTPGPGEVRIAVKASGVNFADIVARTGIYPDAPPFPFCPGYEVAGTIDALGPGVTGLAVGDRVLALTKFGGYASRAVADARILAKVPERLSWAQAAAIPVNYLTAWHALVTLGNLRPGERVLIHAAAGGVGVAALQICKHKQAGRVLGTASPGKHARLKSLGLTDAIDYTTADVEVEVKRLTDGKGVHVCLDAVGGSMTKKSYASLATGGRLVCFGVSSFTGGGSLNLWRVLTGWLGTPKFDAIDLMTTNKGVFGLNMLTTTQAEPELVASELQEVVRLCGEGVLDPTIDQSIPFTEAAKAHDRLEGRGNFGKVVLDFEKA